MTKYKITVIIAIYNMENYLNETINSVISQDIGFEKVQLILVNDGSTDKSAAICHEYVDKYKNIIYIEKENGGVSSARNEGLKRATGGLVNFLDADDLMTEDTFSHVYHFYKKHKKELDVVAIPMQYFGARDQAHALNNKFDETRVINIEKEPNYIQLSVSSAFIARKSLLDIQFNINLKYGEDTDVITRILYDKMNYGVVAEGKYMYRYRDSVDSAMQKAKGNKDNYITLAQNYMELIKYFLERTNKISKYLQNVIIYNIGWRIRTSYVDESVMSKTETDEYLCMIKNLLQHIDDKVILGNTFLNVYYKMYELEIKYDKKIEDLYHIIRDENHALVCYESYLLNDLSKQVVYIENIVNDSNGSEIRGRMNSVFPRDDMEIIVRVEEKDYPAVTYEEPEQDIYSLNRLVRKVMMYTVKVDKEIKSIDNIEIYVKYCGQKSKAKVKGEDIENVIN